MVLKIRPQKIKDLFRKSKRKKQVASPYAALVGPHSTRVLKVIRQTPEASDSKLEVVLREIDLDSAKARPYTCISYTWGSPTSGPGKERYEGADGLVPITVRASGGPAAGALRMNIGRNLYEGLSEIVNGGHCSGELWADSICINQSDIDERNRQVQAMALIFSRAESVIVWLGRGDDHLADFVDFCNGFIMPAKAWAEEHGGRLPTFIRTDDDYSSFRHEVTGDIVPAGKLMPLFYFFDHTRWLTRMWVIPELALCREAIFVYGTQTLTMANAMFMMQWMVANFALSWIVVYQLEPWDTRRPSEQGRFRLFSTLFALRILAKYRSEIRDFSKIHGLYSPGADSNVALLMEFLHVSRGFSCTNPRDSIYPILGLFSHNTPAPKRPLIAIDYDTPIREVFCSLSRRLIESLESLSIFALLEGRECDDLLSLPSWCPDWDCAVRSLNFREYRGHFLENVSSLPKRTSWDAYPTRSRELSGVEFEGDDLWLMAARCDVVEAKSQKYSSPDWDVYNSLEACHFVLEAFAWMGETYSLQERKTTEAAAALLVRWDRTFPETLDAAWFASALVEFIWSTLAVAQRDMAGPAPANWHELGIEVLQQITRHLRRLTGFAGLPLRVEDCSHRERLCDRAKDDEAPGFKFQKAFNKSRQGASCCYRTSKGFLGDTYTPRIRTGDELWLPCRGRIPLILRPAGQPRRYHVLGEAYVLGGMYGELVEKGFASDPERICLV